MALWVTHTNKGEYDADFRENSHVAIGYRCRLNLAEVGSKEALQQQQGSGSDILWRFYSEVQERDLVVVPFKDAGASFKDARVSIGEVAGTYRFRPDTDPYHVRPVRWIAHGIPAAEFDEDIFGSLANEPAFHRIAKPNAEERVRRLASWNGIDAYIRRAQPYIESGRLDTEEMEYKLETVERLGKIRAAAFANDEDWPALVGRALLESNLSGGGWRASEVITKWLRTEPEGGSGSLESPVVGRHHSAGERISAFLNQVPEDANFTGSRDPASADLGPPDGTWPGVPTLQDHRVPEGLRANRVSQASGWPPARRGVRACSCLPRSARGAHCGTGLRAAAQSP